MTTVIAISSRGSSVNNSTYLIIFELRQSRWCLYVGDQAKASKNSPKIFGVGKIPFSTQKLVPEDDSIICNGSSWAREPGDYEYLECLNTNIWPLLRLDETDSSFPE
jgi:hypothetical protein